ncbi:Type III pantothenate kinase [Limihaloglobus sulfuriphilus]|uniref:Type III pantothenate kinase n=1 Tax=Limihaloglobus sulfuriphilus TaxID=1851148 RepID=A0A1Q2MJA7_9BACT|nr:type III pantothenate kinase [Limihaloglobus sulfuriphilus]AQQ72507.1 Type III pantothenate kinase [Limihaloglobus sulfuriphilus]
MNILAIDIGNTNIKFGLFLEGEAQPVKSVGVNDDENIRSTLHSLWEQVPAAPRSKEKLRDAVIVVCSVNPPATERFRTAVSEEIKEKILEIGLDKDVPLPIKLGVEYPADVGVDRVLAAAAAYLVVEQPVIVADFGTAITIDAVDDDGTFMGGIIAPGIAVSAKSLAENTAKLPEIVVNKPVMTLGGNTRDAINNGIYFAAVGLLETTCRKFAEEMEVWPQTIVTGDGAETIKEDCKFVDNWVPSLVIKGIVLAYMKYIQERPVS